MRERFDKLVVVLAVLCAGTAAVALFAGADTAVVSATPPTTEAESSAIESEPDELEPISPERKSRDAYAEMLRRPLFNATRRPDDLTLAQSPLPPQTLAQAPAQSNHRLVGVVMIDDKQFALIHDPATRTTERVTVGETISGWKVSELTPNAATITQSGQSRTIKLERKSSPQRAAKLKAANKRRLAAREAAAARRAAPPVPPTSPPDPVETHIENTNNDNSDNPPPDEP